MALIDTFDDGSIRFTPPHGKEAAEYVADPGRGVPSGARCGNCAHFIEGGGCHVVQGRIDPGAVCLEFFADVGVFADNEFEPPISMILERGGVTGWTEEDAMLFANRVRIEIERLR